MSDSTPVPVVIRGTLYPSLSAAARAVGVSPHCVWFHLKNGTLDRAGLRGARFTSYTYDGKQYSSMSACARAHGIRTSTFTARVQAGRDPVTGWKEMKDKPLLVAPTAFCGRTSRWQDSQFRSRRAAWMAAQNRAGYSTVEIARATGISVYSVTSLLRAYGYKLRRSGQKRLSVPWGSLLSMKDFNREDLDAIEEIVLRRKYESAHAFFRACVIDGIAEEREELDIRKAS